MSAPDQPTSFAIPESIESARLRLRTAGAEDAQALHAYYSDADSTRYTTLRPYALDETRAVLAAVARHWQRRGYGPYVLEERATGAVVGIAGLWYPKEWPEPEIKWALVPAQRGRGYATEAARAVREMAARRLPELRLISLIHRDNAASVRVALALGAALEREMDFRGGIYGLYRHRAGEGAGG